MIPKRIQRQRTKGWRIPPNTVCVSRPSKFSNPFKLADAAAEAAQDLRSGALPVPADKYDAWLPYARGIVLQRYRAYLAANPALAAAAKEELRGKNLACWCREDQACHADILLEIANQ